MDRLFATVRDIALRMGVETVLADQYSNAKWIRVEVSALPTEYYHVRDVEKPFGLASIQAMVEE
ncbi:MAG: hypothetical protein O3A00_09485 [Planctomycetota bacterium]|nr:hypothetical protein [Planctomycetota bacterium]